MYSMVLMAAMLPAGDTASFGGKKGGCDGGCSGAAASCKGGGFLGLKDKGSCSGGGFLGLKDKGGCSGGGFLGHKHKSSGGCTGTPAPTCDTCDSGIAVPPPPVVMPKPETKPEVKPEPKPMPKKGD